MRKKYSESEKKRRSKIRTAKWRENNPEKYKAALKRQQERRKNDPEEKEKFRLIQKKWRLKPENKEKLNNYIKEYLKRPEVRKKTNEKQREKRKKNPEKYKALDKKYRLNKMKDPKRAAQRRKTMNEWMKKKRTTDNYYKIRMSLSASLAQFLKRKGTSKAGSITDLVGCSKKALIAHIEKQFHDHPETGEMMSWNNYSKRGWHVDHKIPMAYHKDNLHKIDVQKKIMHFTNLQPMWAEFNQKKGDKLI